MTCTVPEVRVPSDFDTEDYRETLPTGGGGVVAMKDGQENRDHVDIYVGLAFDGFHDYDNVTDVNFRFFQPPTFDTVTRLVIYRPQSFSGIDITVRFYAISSTQCWMKHTTKSA